MNIAIPAFIAIMLASCIGKLIIAYAEKRRIRTRRISKTNNKQKDKEKK